jgi:hypothetical protein
MAEAIASRIQVAVRCDRCVDVCGRSDSFCGYFPTAELACYRPLLPGRRPVLNAVVSRRSVTGMPGGREGVALGPPWHASLQGRQAMLPANQRTHEKVVAMRSHITRRLVIAVRAVPAIDADAPGRCLF